MPSPRWRRNSASACSTERREGVSLTEAGEQFVSGVAPALGQIREAMERAGSHRETPAGTLRINTSAGAARQMEPIVFEYLR
jgi:DNA-binding transcriptional LysR family regulator